jgi:hypothetical protein
MSFLNKQAAYHIFYQSAFHYTSIDPFTIIAVVQSSGTFVNGNNTLFYRRGYLKNRKPQGPDPTKQDKE